MFADELLHEGVFRINGDIDKVEKFAYMRLFTSSLVMRTGHAFRPSFTGSDNVVSGKWQTGSVGWHVRRLCRVRGPGAVGLLGCLPWRSLPTVTKDIFLWRAIHLFFDVPCINTTNYLIFQLQTKHTHTHTHTHRAAELPKGGNCFVCVTRREQHPELSIF